MATLGRQTPAQPVRVFCHDESRCGLFLPVRRRLTSYGVKPVQGVEPLYESSWVYAAVAPTTGDAFWWELPRLDADCFTVFLHPFGHHYSARLNLVLLDHAPAHMAQRVQSPDNVVLVWRPAYSPELHPVERLWEDRNSRIDRWDARVRSSLTALQEHVAGLVRRYTAEAIASLTGYSYLLEAARALCLQGTGITTLWLQADQTGVFRGQCAEFCGYQHAHMALLVLAEPPAQFHAWLEAQRAPAVSPTSALQQHGQQVFLSSSCVLCHTIRGTPAGGKTAPDLTHLASRQTLAAGTLPNTPGHLAGWIIDAQRLKPGSKMPPNGMPPGDLQALLAYLESLK
jgi:cytochrome c1